MVYYLCPLRMFLKLITQSSLLTCITLFAMIGLDSGAALAQAKLITFEEIKLIAPKAKDEFVQAIVDAEGEFKAAGITTRLRMAHFLTQVMTETGGLGRIDENMNYKFKTLMRVFSRKTISESKARDIAGDPHKIANWVYGHRLGNQGRETDDGWNYRGSGFMQLTGRLNFRSRGKEIGLPLEQSPELARRTPEGLTAAIAYWKARNVNGAADDHDPLRVRILINGPAAHGYKQSNVWFKQIWTRVLRDKAGAGFEMSEELASGETLDDKELFDDIMKESGLLPDQAFETVTDAAKARTEALKEFQRELGLPETGTLDDATKEELLNPREWRYLDDPDVASARPEADLEQTATFELESVSSTGVEAAAPVEIEPSKGSGIVVPDANIAPEDLVSLTEASGMYSTYEMGDASVKMESFIPFSVIGDDTRAAVIDTTGFPARAIVQILFETRSGSQHLCSGTMVSKNTVLTAAHCIHSGTSAGQPYQNFRVIPGRNVGAAPFGRCRGRKAYVLSGWTASLAPTEGRYYDLGAIKLDCDVGDTTGWLGVRSLDDSEVGIGTTVQGYTADRAPPGRQWVSEDKLRLVWEFKGFYQNDTFGGTSGGAVLATGSNDVLIGVHTNGLHGQEQPWASNNAFTRITPERLARVREWIDD